MRFLHRGGRRILLVDLSWLREPAQVQAEVRTACDLLRREPEPALTLTLVRGAARAPVVLDALRDLAGRHPPLVAAGAVVGMEGVHRALYRALVLFSRLNLEAFDDVDRALAWLTAQA